MKLAEALRERKQLQIKMGTLRQKLIDKLVLADSTRLSASDGQEPEKTEILR